MWSGGVGITIPGTPHTLSLQVSDVQESRNMENVGTILPHPEFLTALRSLTAAVNFSGTLPSSAFRAAS